MGHRGHRGGHTLVVIHPGEVTEGGREDERERETKTNREIRILAADGPAFQQFHIVTLCLDKRRRKKQEPDHKEVIKKQNCLNLG